MTTQNKQDTTLDKVISPIVDDTPATDKAKDDKLEKEVTGKDTSETQFQLPEKFKGKSAEDIAQSYISLEQDYGRRGNELGDLRKVNDQLLGLQLDNGKASDTSDPDKQPLTSDELLSDPGSAIDRVLNSNKRLDDIERTLNAQTVATKKAQFDTKHPNGIQQMNSPEFQSWLQKSSVRQNLYSYANNNYDYEVGGELLDMFNEIQGKAAADTADAETAAKNKNKADMDAMSMEKGGTGERKAPVFYREDIIDLRLNNEAEYNRLYPEIFKAYQEGRVKNKRK